MNYVKEELLLRLEYLEKIRKEKEKAVKAAPGGKLRISHSHGRVQFYQKRNSKDRTGNYLPASEKELARRLAQKDYDSKVLQKVKTEQEAIQKILVLYPEILAEDLFEGLSDIRKALVDPVRETDEMYVRQWEEKIFQGKPGLDNNHSFLTDRGERVRSKSEVIIANALNKEGVPYRYECPVILEGTGKVYPDFTILNVRLRKEILWEHFGMMDNPEYAENAVRKYMSYQKNGAYPGDRLITTWETRMTPIDPLHIRTLIRHYAL